MVKIPIKRKVVMYAHNGANFDSYFALQIKGVKAISCVEKGGLLSVSLDSEMFENCTFTLKDTRRFIMGSLSQLCTSYKVPE